MNKIEHPIQSVKSLIKASVSACLLAIAVLLVAVLPAEYGIDLTGLGQKMGLMVLAKANEKPVVESCDGKAALRADSVNITVPARSGLEYKLFMQKGEELDYSWTTDGVALYFDFHGEPQGDTTGYFKSYKERTLTNDRGSKEMPFAGSHGWYWKNDTDSPVTVSLKTKGVYQVIGIR
jgi:predicted lipoprotein with Yx(FWY)xxD motif